MRIKGGFLGLSKMFSVWPRSSVILKTEISEKLFSKCILRQNKLILINKYFLFLPYVSPHTPFNWHFYSSMYYRQIDHNLNINHAPPLNDLLFHIFFMLWHQLTTCVTWSGRQYALLQRKPFFFFLRGSLVFCLRATLLRSI